MDRAIYDRMAEIDAEHWWFAARRRIVAAMIERLALPERARLLEVGCGTGSNLMMLQRFGRLDAIEPDSRARALASRRGGIAVAGGLLPHEAQIEDNAYDLIVLLDVLEHVPDDAGTLKLLARKLKPGGRLLLTVPASPWMWSAHDLAHHHQRRYTARTLRSALTANGFRIAHLSHFNTILYPVIAAARMLGKLMGREGGDDAMPPAPVNRLLGAVFGAERHVAVRGSLPFGVSLLAVAEPTIR
ncbi:MAG: class I SAM-dependent methyltransferase [Sphingomonadaceae bacterium]|nr:class I SAM-dependent methyltransferase [Sphingomonadaceae bacterium]